MGNRAVITTEKREIALYLHWNGGRDSVEAFLTYCRLRGFRAPDQDPYGWARLAQVIANYMGADGLSVGISPYTTDEAEMPGDNGIYVIRGWEIQDRILAYPDYEEEDVYDLDDMLLDIDRSQPEHQQLGDEFLLAAAIPPSELEVDDYVWRLGLNGRYALCRVMGFGEPGRVVNGHDVSGVPYTNMYGSEPYAGNVNNYLFDETVRCRGRF